MTPGTADGGTRAWPLARLFDALHQQGFRLRPDDYVEIDLVVRAFRPATPAELKALIAPLIVASDDEQEQFDTLFDSLQLAPITLNGSTKEPEEPEKPEKPWRRIVLTLVAVVLAVTVGWLGYRGLQSWAGPKFDPSVKGPFVVGKADAAPLIVVGDSLVFFRRLHATTG